MKPEVQFNALTHTYRVNGNRLPSVTGIISTVVPRQWNADDWALRRGSMVHKALALHLAGCLDMDTVDERIADRVNAGVCAIRDYGWQPGIIEQPMFHPVFYYCGMPDFISECGDLVDWKGTVEATAEIQLGFYALLAEANKIKVKRLFAVRTGEMGYRVETYRLHRAKALAVSFLGVYGFLTQN